MMSVPRSLKPAAEPERLVSLDAFRGFVMLAMASAGFQIDSVWNRHREAILADGGSESVWSYFAYHFSHAPWVGGGFWDMIQPAFMFMVGVAVPFSLQRRKEKGDSAIRRTLHMLLRCVVLILLGIFLSSNGSKMTNFTFVNVLTQIGLGYWVVYLLADRKAVLQVAAIAVILGGYWFWFYQYEIPPAEEQSLSAYLEHLEAEGKYHLEKEPVPMEGLAAHWNKHTNAAAGFDRWFLNLFPRAEEEFGRQKFWINSGGYQTLNFIPSIATMLFGLIAGQILISLDEGSRKLQLLLVWAAVCFVIALGLDTKVWPVQISSLNWSFCPTVKRIWTPSWAIYSSGWTFLMMAIFYLFFDLLPFKKGAFPLAIVGMNSIAFYIMAQLIKPWTGRTIETHLTTVDAAFGTSVIENIYREPFEAIWVSLMVLFALWLVALWMYCRKLFIRI